MVRYFDITDANGDIYATGSGYASNANLTITACIPVGAYNFNMYDSFGDGWNGGTYNLSSTTGAISNGLLPGSQGQIHLFLTMANLVLVGMFINTFLPQVLSSCEE